MGIPAVADPRQTFGLTIARLVGYRLRLCV